MGSLITALDSNYWRVLTLITLIFTLYFLLVENNLICQKPKEADASHFVYVGYGYAPKNASSRQRYRILDVLQPPRETIEVPSAQTGDDVTWEEWYREWDRRSEADGIGMTGDRLCLSTNRKTYVRCGAEDSPFHACVDASSGVVSTCGLSTIEPYSLPLCVEISTEEVVTCGNFTAVNLCSPSKEELMPLRPCTSNSRRVCLLDDGYLGNCLRMPDEPAVLSNTAVAAVKGTEEGRIVAKNQRKGLVQLCENDMDGSLYKCNTNSSLIAACLAIKDWTIRTCDEIERKTEFGIPVCIQENSSNLVTCEKFSHSNVCMYYGAENFQLIPCQTPSRFVCVTGEGSLKLCTFLGKRNNKEINTSGESPESAFPEKYDATELKSRSVERICKRNDENDFIECSSDDSNSTIVCLDLKNGKIDSCESIGYHNPSIPLCVMGSEKYVVTCGRFNLAPVCLSTKNGSYEYNACVNTDNFVCLDSRSVKSCKNSRSPVSKRSSASSEKSSSDSKTSDFPNEKRVYDAETKIGDAIMKDRERLCQKRGEPHKYILCREEKSLRFVCLSPGDGKHKLCESFHPSELGVPLCVRKSREVVSCGKFAKSALCLYEVLDDTVISGCLRGQGKRACLSEEGEFEACTSSTTDDGNEEEEEGPEDDSESVKTEDEIRDKILAMVDESHKNKRMLCIRDENKYDLVSCDEDPSFNFACMGALEGRVRRCSAYKEDFPIAVCALADTYHVVTCDIFTSIHLCLSKMATSTYIFPCEIPDQHSCVTREGYLGKCIEHSRGPAEPMKSSPADDDSPLPLGTVGTYGPISDAQPMKLEHSTTDEEYSKDHDGIEPHDEHPMNDVGDEPRDGNTRNQVRHSEGTPAPPGGTDEKFYRINCNNCTIDHKFVIVGTPDDVLPAVEVRTFPDEEH